MENLIMDGSKIVAFIGVMAFLVEVITEMLKKWKWFDERVPTVLVVLVAALVLCPLAMLALFSYYNLVITWYVVFASFLAAFIVALVCMEGWERITSLVDQFIKK